ncbi:reverse transcriptase domain-containing protein [Tanacetum coccineum]
MSNLMKVLGFEATQDPTRLEMEIRSAAAEREQAHVDMNIERKLTPAERRVKKERKLFYDNNTLETIVSVWPAAMKDEEQDEDDDSEKPQNKTENAARKVFSDVGVGHYWDLSVNFTKEKMPPKKTTTPMTDEAIRALIAQGVANALAEHEANKGRNGDDNHDSGSYRRRRMPVTHKCTYTDFLKCQPLNFKGTEGVVGLTQWTVSHEVAYGMTWKALKNMMTDKYCPRGEINKLEIELWNLKVKKYVDGLPDMIQGSVMASKPKTMQDAIEIANDLMDQKIYTFAERQAEHKRKLDDDNQAQHQPPKKQNVARAYSAGSSEKKEYVGTLSLCNKCKFHHNGPCTVKCANCKRIGHLTRDCRSPVATNNPRTLTCYECGNQRHYRSDCLELKNRSHGNQGEGTKVRGMVYALGGGETDQDLDNMEDDINA